MNTEPAGGSDLPTLPAPPRWLGWETSTGWVTPLPWATPRPDSSEPTSSDDGRRSTGVQPAVEVRRPVGVRSAGPSIFLLLLLLIGLWWLLHR